MHFDDAQWTRLIDAAAQELFEVYWKSHGVALPNWDTCASLQKVAWIKVAEHVVQQNTELFGMLTAPDHK